MERVKPEYSSLLRTSQAPIRDLVSAEKSRLKEAWVSESRFGGLGSRALIWACSGNLYYRGEG